MSAAVFYHAGCPVCLGAEHTLVNAINQDQHPVEIVHLGEQSHRIAEAESAGVHSVPALVMNGQVFHINFGAALIDLAA